MQLVCISRDSSFDKNKYLNHVFSMNNYNDDFIKRKKYMKLRFRPTAPSTPTSSPHLNECNSSKETISLPPTRPQNLPIFFVTTELVFIFGKD